ncbi:MAG: hypothetical protein ACREOF_02025 [Gemmatimonadales bacterium]
MTRRAAPGVLLAAAPGVLLAAALWGCGGAASDGPDRSRGLDAVPAELRDAAFLGREIFDLVDRAADYKGSHRGRPPRSLKQMGLDSLAGPVVRRIRTVSDSSVVTVAYRQPRGRVVASCEANARILEESALNEGRFTLLCSTPSGAITKYEVPGL